MSGLLPKGSDATLQLHTDEVAREYQKISHKTLTAAPAVADVPQGGVVFANVSGTVYLYTNLNGKLYRVAMTAV